MTPLLLLLFFSALTVSTQTLAPSLTFSYSHILSVFLLSTQVGSASASAGENLYTPKANLIRYWNKEVKNNHAKPTFLLSKASPLSAVDAERFSKLAAQNALSSQFPSICPTANLLCFPDSSPTLQELISHPNIINFRNIWRLQGIFFRESMLKKGKVMPMPDIKDKMPERSFLPRSISSKIPFSTSKISELKKIFRRG